MPSGDICPEKTPRNHRSVGGSRKLANLLLRRSKGEAERKHRSSARPCQPHDWGIPDGVEVEDLAYQVLAKACGRYRTSKSASLDMVNLFKLGREIKNHPDVPWSQIPPLVRFVLTQLQGGALTLSKGDWLPIAMRSVGIKTAGSDNAAMILCFEECSKPAARRRKYKLSAVRPNALAGPYKFAYVDRDVKVKKAAG